MKHCKTFFFSIIRRSTSYISVIWNIIHGFTDLPPWTSNKIIPMFLPANDLAPTPKSSSQTSRLKLMGSFKFNRCCSSVLHLMAFHRIGCLFRVGWAGFNIASTGFSKKTRHFRPVSAWKMTKNIGQKSIQTSLKQPEFSYLRWSRRHYVSLGRHLKHLAVNDPSFKKRNNTSTMHLPPTDEDASHHRDY